MRITKNLKLILGEVRRVKLIEVFAPETLFNVAYVSISDFFNCAAFTMHHKVRNRQIFAKVYPRKKR